MHRKVRMEISMIRRFLTQSATAALLMIAPASMHAQFGPPPPQAPRPAKTIAPEDLTGYWVSIVTEDWRWRMVTPAKGDFASIPFTPEGKKVGEAWDPAKDEASGD